MKNTSEVSDKIFKILSRILKIPLNKIDDNFEMNKVSQWDSVAHLDIISTCEDEFNIQFDASEISKLINLKNINKIIQQKIKKK
tara:strand:- start:183 stop:434 length:252 start_codon:yes stop_codon:yes gene_type:complete